MRMLNRSAALAGAALVWMASVSHAQQALPINQDPLSGIGQATTQYYNLQLRDAEAKLRAAHERLAAPGSHDAHQAMVDAVRDASDVVRNAPQPIAGQPVHAEAERRFAEGMARLERDQNDADVGRDMLQALSTLREATGASPATGGPAPPEPAAGGGGRT